MAQKPKDDFTPDDFEPEMTFAIVNGVRVPLGGDTSDFPEINAKDDFTPDDFEADKVNQPTETRETPMALGLMQRAMQPLVDVSPTTRQHMQEFEQVHPVLGKIGRTALDMVLGESSPLSLGLGGLGAGESVASGMGMEGLASALKIPSRAAGAGMVWHGLGNVGSGEGLGEKLGGGLEALLGGLAMKGPKAIPKQLERATPEIPQLGGDVLDTEARRLERQMQVPDVQVGTPPFNTNQFGLSSQSAPLNYPLSIVPDRLRPPGTNATVFDALLPDRYKRRVGEEPATTSIGNTLEQVQPQPAMLERPALITAQDKSFYDKIKDLTKEFITSESGTFDFSKLGTRRHPLRALDELHDALIDAAEKRNETEGLYKQERSKRFRDVEEIQTQGRKGFYERLSKLKGELPKAEFEPVSINPDSARALYNEIQRSELSTPEKIRTSVALGKILGDYGNGTVPQRNEIELLRRVFGDPIADSLTQMHAGIPFGRTQLNEIANLSKSMMASYDMSAPFRQGLGLIHTKEFWKNYSKMFTYLGRGAYDVAMQSINEHPMFEPLKRAGLQITEIGSELGAREEQFASRIAEHIPGIPASERMYTGFLNKTRFDVSKRLIEEAEKAGLQPFIRSSTGEIIPTKLGKEIASFVNTATGRGSLGRFEKNAVELNSLFFSPRLISSRLTMLNPNYYITASPFVRKQALKSLFAMATAGKVVEELGKAAGGSVETSDPLSTDYHKVRIGNTRLDPYGGYQQYIVAANRLLAGAYNSAMGNDEKMQLKQAFTRTLGVGGRFGSFTENKLSPLVKFADDILSGRPAEDKGVGSALNLAGVEHKPFTAKVINQFTPMILQDLADLMQEDPSLIPLSLLGASGMGVQTYGNEQQDNNTRFRELAR